MARARGPKKSPVVSEYLKATDVRDIAQELISRHGMSLRDAHIEYYIKTRTRDGVAEPVRAQDEAVPGRVSAGSPRDQKMLKRHFVLEVNGNAWLVATPQQREALVFELLSRCWFTQGRPRITPYDVRGVMRETVRLYGMYSPGLKKMEQALQQYTLDFGEPEKPVTTVVLKSPAKKKAAAKSAAPAAATTVEGTSPTLAMV
jgi:hypothetical protein